MLKRTDSGTACEVQTAFPDEQTKVAPQMAKWTVRVGMVLRLLVVVVPVSAVGVAVWSIWPSYGPESAAAARYAAATQCSPTAQARDCYVLEHGQLLSLSWTYAGFGAYTDTLIVSLPDGSHRVDVFFDTFGPKDVRYANSDGQVTVKLYQGQITEVFAADGSAFETTESPATASQRGKGPQILTIVFFGAWLLIVLYALVRHPGAIKYTWIGITTGRLVDS